MTPAAPARSLVFWQLGAGTAQSWHRTGSPAVIGVGTSPQAVPREPGNRPLQLLSAWPWTAPLQRRPHACLDDQAHRPRVQPRRDRPAASNSSAQLPVPVDRREHQPGEPLSIHVERRWSLSHLASQPSAPA
jgi:hypothetical protein